MVKVKASRGFISTTYGSIDKDQVIEVPRKYAQHLIDAGMATLVEEYQTKVIIPGPLVPEPAPAPQPQSLPADPALPEPTPPKQKQKRRSSRSTTQ